MKLNLEKCELYKAHFFSKYKSYHVKDIKQSGVDFLEDYSGFCKIGNCKKTDYECVQGYQIYTVADSIVTSVFDYQLVYFYDRKIMDTVVAQIKASNCIDDPIMRIDRIYKIGGNCIIGVSSSGFDLLGYENFLISEFDKSVTIEVINASD